MNKLKALWEKLPDGVKRVIHTAWVTFLGVFSLGITQVLANLVQTHNFSDAKSALVALIVAGVVAAGTAVRVAIANALAGRA